MSTTVWSTVILCNICPPPSYVVYVCMHVCMYNVCMVICMYVCMYLVPKKHTCKYACGSYKVKALRISCMNKIHSPWFQLCCISLTLPVCLPNSGARRSKGPHPDDQTLSETYLHSVWHQLPQWHGCMLYHRYSLYE